MTEIASMTIGELGGWVVVALAAISTVIQLSPIKIDPWTWLARKIGRAINGDVIAEVEMLNREVEAIRDEANEREAKAARARILRFGDECLHDIRHTKEHFDQIMRDIKEYETFCKDHPRFENNTAVFTIKRINEIYQKRLIDNSFL